MVDVSKFKVGDKVKIVGNPSRLTAYNEHAANYLGKATEVIGFNVNGLYLLKDTQYGWEESELELIEPIQDNVKSPSHYQMTGLEPYESVDVIKSTLTKIEFKGWCKGNALKYNMRERKKNGLEDLQKAGVNQEWVIEADKAIKIEKERLTESFIDELEAIDDSGQISEELFIKLCDLVTDIVDKTLEV